jgi:hypothetical protein
MRGTPHPFFISAYVDLMAKVNAAPSFYFFYDGSCTLKKSKIIRFRKFIPASID